MFDHTAVAAMGVDPAGRIVVWNHTAGELFGYSSQQAASHRCFALVAGSDARGNLLCHAGCSIMLMFRRGEPPNDYLLRSHNSEGDGLLLNVSTVLVDTDEFPVCLHLFHDVSWIGEAPSASARPQAEGPPPSVTLTAREREILRLMVEGRDSHEMQKLLHISYATVRNHIQNILDKLEVHTRVAAVVVAIRENLVEDPTRNERKERSQSAEPLRAPELAPRSQG
jgi:PAS domain S-box-containing protein